MKGYRWFLFSLGVVLGRIFGDVPHYISCGYIAGRDGYGLPTYDGYDWMHINRSR
jgi:hypothetical protein